MIRERDYLTIYNMCVLFFTIVATIIGSLFLNDMCNEYFRDYHIIGDMDWENSDM